MKLAWPVEIAGTGAGIPEQRLTNADFVRRLDTSDEWIVQRTGIHERRIASEGESTLTFAVQAGRQAIERAGITPRDVDLIICATITPEHVLPATSCELQAALGCGHAPALDLVAACSGFVYGAITAAQYIICGMARHVLVVGADCMTRLADMEDRASCILFGDGAGAAVLRAAANPESRFLAARMGCDGTRAELIWVPAGGAREPASVRTVNERLHFMRMRGREVYRFAVTQMYDLVRETLQDAQMTLDMLDMLVPHQSNLRMIESACQRLGLPSHKVFINIGQYGNTSSASVPIALHEAFVQKRIRPGDSVLMVAFGAGLTWGSLLLRL